MKQFDKVNSQHRSYQSWDRLIHEFVDQHQKMKTNKLANLDSNYYYALITRARKTYPWASEVFPHNPNNPLFLFFEVNKFGLPTTVSRNENQAWSSKPRDGPNWLVLFNITKLFQQPWIWRTRDADSLSSWFDNLLTLPRPLRYGRVSRWTNSSKILL